MRNTGQLKVGYHNFISISQTSFEEAFSLLDESVRAAQQAFDIDFISGAWRTQDDGGRCVYVTGQTTVLKAKKK